MAISFKILLFTFSSLLFVGTVNSASLEAGRKAWEKGNYISALAEFQELANEGNSEAQLNVGLFYQFGHGTSKNIAKAKKWFEKSAEQGNQKAKKKLETIQRQDKISDERIAELVRKIAEEKRLLDEAKKRQQKALQKSASLKRQIAEKKKENAAQKKQIATLAKNIQLLKHLYTCLELAGSSFDNGLPAKLKGVPYLEIDTEKAVPTCKLVAENDTLPSEHAPRIWYTYGRALGRAGRISDAASWYEKASDAGFPLGHHNLADILEIGRGDVRANPSRAFQLYRKSADAGLSVSFYALGLMTKVGNAVPKNKMKAAGLFGEAAERGFLPANKEAIRLWEAGLDGSKPNYEAAAKYWRILSKSGDADAAYELAQRLRDGKIASNDDSELRKNFEYAANGGNQKAAYQYAKWLMKQKTSEGRNNTALRYAYLAFDIAAKAKIDTEYGWLLYQQDAASQVVSIIDQTKLLPRSKNELKDFRADFVPTSMKSFTVSTVCNGQKTPFKIYIWDWTRDHPQTDEQADWWQKARGCEFSKDVIESYRKLFNIAKDNELSFSELAFNAYSDSKTDHPEKKENPNSPETLFALGKEHAKSKDYKKAVQYFEKSAELGYMPAHEQAAFALEKGASPDFEAAAVHWRILVKSGDANAAFALERRLRDGKVHAIGSGERLKLLRMAAAAGLKSAEYQLKKEFPKAKSRLAIVATGKEKKNNKKPNQAAGKNSRDALFFIGMRYLLGKGKPKSFVEAAKLFQKAAERGHATAQLILGQMYEKGDGVVKSNITARKWYRESIKQGNTKAQKHLVRVEQKITVSERAKLKPSKQQLKTPTNWNNARSKLGEMEYKRGLEFFARKDYKNSEKSFSISAEMRNPNGQYWLGGQHEKGLGVPVDLAKALSLFVEACNGGLGRACNRAGLQYDSRGVAEDQSRATQFYVKACDGDYAIGCYAAGLRYGVGQGVAEDQTRATQLYVKACDGGNADGCFNAGFQYHKGKGVAEDQTRAARLFVKACDGDIATGCSGAGLQYEKGQGVAEDQTRAAQLFVKACDGDFADGCFNAGLHYEKGQGVAEDLTRATQLYVKACDGGNADGCFNAGVQYNKGRGVAEDQTRATQFYVKACDGDIPIGCAGAGVRYEEGQGAAKDLTRAVQLYLKACDGGFALGCSLAAFRYSSGQGVPQDKKLSIQLYVKACDAGNMASCENLGMLYSTRDREDRGLAAQYFTKACEGSSDATIHDISCISGGIRYSIGNGVAIDINRAMRLFAKSCGSRISSGCVYAGELIAEKKVVTAGLTKAADYFYEALVVGSTEPISFKKGHLKPIIAKHLQKRLKSNGFYKGSIDGDIGRGTIAAMEKLCKCRVIVDSKS